MSVYKLLSFLEKVPLWCRLVMAVGWYAFIWYLTELPQAGSQNTKQAIMQAGGSEEAHFVFRTTSHFFVFGIQALLVYYILCPSFLFKKGMFLAVLLVILCLGTLDEFHQSFVPGRLPRGVDVIKDVIGALLFLCAAFVAKYFLKHTSSELNTTV